MNFSNYDRSTLSSFLFNLSNWKCADIPIY